MVARVGLWGHAHHERHDLGLAGGEYDLRGRDHQLPIGRQFEAGREPPGGVGVVPDADCQGQDLPRHRFDGGVEGGQVQPGRDLGDGHAQEQRPGQERGGAAGGAAPERASGCAAPLPQDRAGQPVRDPAR